MDCAACSIATQKKIENNDKKIDNNEKKGAQSGSPEHTEKLKSVRESNNVDATKEHKDAAFCLHAAGIFADYYTDNILNNNLGSPPEILDYAIPCSLQESKVLGDG
jgi:hypothetical protein